MTDEYFTTDDAGPEYSGVEYSDDDAAGDYFADLKMTHDEYDQAAGEAARTGDWSRFDDHDGGGQLWDDDDDLDVAAAHPADNPRDERYRARLRDAERERDAMTERLDVMRANEIERIAGKFLADAGDFWRDRNFADAFDENENVDPDRVRDACKDIIAKRPHVVAPPDRYRGPLYSGATSQRIERPKGIAAAFTPHPNDT